MKLRFEGMATLLEGSSPDKITIEPVKGLKGELEVPGDKSISHRTVILGSIAGGITEAEGFLWSEDNIMTVEALRRMGTKIEKKKSTVIIEGKGLYGLEEANDIIYTGNSGTTTRLLVGLLAAQKFFSVISGDESLRRRPMGRVVKPLSLMGATIYGRDGGNFAPLAIIGSVLKAMEYNSPIASAQVKSAILLAGLYAKGETSFIEPYKSRDHTERMLDAFGADIIVSNNKVVVKGKRQLKGCKLKIPGDISSAAFFMVAALITPESELLIKQVGINPTRTGFIDLLLKMGGNIEILNESVQSTEPVADILVRSSRLHGIDIGEDDVPGAIDEFPVLCIAAAAAEGRTVIRGASELRVKESDRISTMAEGLSSMGVHVEELPDGIVIDGGHGLSGSVVKSYGDHRVAMSMIVAGMMARGITEILGTGCIETSFPDFLGHLKRVMI
jgi:3-phosphoshikimate 1-carboxyvinyltransferase